MKYFLALMLFIASTTSFAGSLICDGLVEKISYHGNNKLELKLSSMNTPVFFCDLSGTWTVPGAEGRNMAPETCKAVFSMFLSAKAALQNMERVHFDGDDVPTSCGDFVEGSSVFVRFVNY